MAAGGLSRLVLATGTAALVVTACLLSVNLLVHRVDTLAEMTLPVGTVVNGDQATLPDSRIVRLAGPMAPPASPEALYPNEPPARVVALNIRPLLLGIALGVPMLAFFGIEAVALAAAWVMRGFKRAPAEAHSHAH